MAPGIKIPLTLMVANEVARDQCNHCPLHISEKTTFAELKKLIENYVTPGMTFVVKYVDEDGDQVSLESDAELAEAIKVGSAAHPVHLRLYIRHTTPSVSRVIRTYSAEQIRDEQIPDECSDTDASVDSDSDASGRDTGVHTHPASFAGTQIHTQGSPSVAETRPATISEIRQLLDDFVPRISERICADLPTYYESRKTNVIHENIICDQCDEAVVGVRYKCISCVDHDLCDACESKHIYKSDHIFLKLREPRQIGCIDRRYLQQLDKAVRRTPPQAEVLNTSVKKLKTKTKNCYLNLASVVAQIKPAKALAPACSFIKDANYPDNTAVEPGVITKRWTLQNTGTTNWPLDTVAKYVHGNLKGVVSSVNVSPATTGEMLDVAVDFKIPSTPGEYHSTWRLSSEAHGEFGHRFWVLVRVLEAQKDTAFDNQVTVTPEPARVSPVNEVPETAIPAVPLKSAAGSPVPVEQLVDFGFDARASWTPAHLAKAEDATFETSTASAPVVDLVGKYEGRKGSGDEERLASCGTDVFEDLDCLDFEVTSSCDDFFVVEHNDAGSHGDSDSEFELMDAPMPENNTDGTQTQGAVVDTASEEIALACRLEMMREEAGTLATLGQGLEQHAADMEQQDSMVTQEHVVVETEASVETPDSLATSVASVLSDKEQVEFTRRSVDQEWQDTELRRLEAATRQAAAEMKEAQTRLQAALRANAITTPACEVQAAAEPAPAQNPVAPACEDVKIISTLLPEPSAPLSPGCRDTILIREDCLRQLFAMGFFDRALNVRLCKEHGDDLQKVINALLEHQDNDWATRRH